MYRILGGDGKEYGPVTLQQLQQWVAEGRVNLQSRVQLDGNTDWKPLAEYPEFQPAPATAAPPPLPTPPVGASKTIGLAITSLVLGILSITCFSILTGIPAIICGILALNRINKSGGRLRGQGQAIGGLVTGGVSLLMIPIMAAMLLPAFSAAREKTRRTLCINNLKQIGLALAQYATDNNDQLPQRQWCDTLTHSGYLSSQRALQCPAGHTEKGAYVFNRNMLGGIWQSDPELVVVLDGDRGWNAVISGPSELPPSVHRAGYNVLFNDGHVAWVPNSGIQQLHWVPAKTTEPNH